MTDSKLEIKVPEELIRAMVSAAVVNQLGDPVAVTAQMIGGYLTRKITKPGEQYGRDEKPAIEWMFLAAAEKIAKEEVQRFIEENKEEIRAAIAKQMKSSTWGPKLAEALVSALSRDSRYGLQFGFDVKLNVTEASRG